MTSAILEQLLHPMSDITLTHSCTLYDSPPPGLRLLKIDSAKPQHGFVRNALWRLTATHTLAGNICPLQFQFSHPADSGKQQLYPWPFIFELTLTFSDVLEIRVSITNLARETTRHSWALHSYFPVTSLATTQVLGLPETVHFDAEVDKLFERVNNEQIIDGEPRIGLPGQGCNTAIVWTPGPKKAALLSDVGTEAYRQSRRRPRRRGQTASTSVIAAGALRGLAAGVPGGHGR